MPERDLSLLIEAAEAAGDVALGYTGKTAKRWEKPDGAGPVTEADLAVNDMLASKLRAARPDYGWLSEENEDDPERLNRDKVFIIDPIDGTRSFADGSRTWAHALAVAERGVVTAAVIYLPQRDLLYTAAWGEGASLNGDKVAPTKADALDGAAILATKANLDPRHWPGSVPSFRRSHRPSLAYRMALVAEGRFDGMLTFMPAWEWDIAAGDLILREAGARITDKAGAALQFNNPRPKLDGVIAGGTTVHQEILAALRIK
ncbi:3'(2'),5'-bisphosphate nucleotidase CysQ [Thalassococcus sp. S3]|uniref:3'(2'),5'-bisphosphate nucleotidase CysQ n=1 Tax=Thalassococcus sp. S3 TaxID=2017482 RepID=UPI0010244787|nr:3'(2'),5'-bisphosphate nucleotidase CysQ [Thalassococcus sp. S3]QBF33808.1 3'(2'),5'-bisphosphate nucleotidase CysQ [Thalassococcus sp. S3]